jgi:hypothetical protein
VWDDGLGDDVGARRLDALARELGGAVAAVSAPDYPAEARQGRTLAERVVYTPALRSAIEATPPGRLVRVRLDAAYRTQLRATTRQQIGVAGARIAEVIGGLFARDGCTR